MWKYFFAFLLFGFISFCLGVSLNFKSDIFSQIIFGLGIVVMILLFSSSFAKELGKPLKLVKLKKGDFYTVLGRDRNMIDEIIFVRGEYFSDPILAVIVPRDINFPNNVKGFYFIKHRNELGKVMKGEGELIFSLGNNMEQQIVFDLKPKKPKS